MTFDKTQLSQIRYDVERMKRQGLIKAGFDAQAFRSEVMKMRAAGLITLKDPQDIAEIAIKKRRSWINTNKQRALLVAMSEEEFQAALAKAKKDKNPQAKRWKRWRERGLRLKETKLCACGCGTVIRKYRRDLRELFYALNHQRRLPFDERRRIEQNVLSSLTEPKTSKQISDETGIAPHRVYDILWDMHNQGVIERIEYGIYRMPKASA